MNLRSLLTLTIGTVAAQALPAPITRAQMVSSAWYPGVSPFGDLKYPSGFKQFDYVNAKAPKGGAARQIALGTYDNFNIVVDGVKGTLALGLDLNYDTLLVPALDEVSTT
jgi:microcin C transport system substrate-binding protein